MKRPTFHPTKLRTICVQPDKYWHCFEGNHGETAERRGGARTGLYERYDAILSKTETELKPRNIDKIILSIGLQGLHVGTGSKYIYL